MVHSRRPKVLANGLQRTREVLGNAAEVGSVRRSRGPKIEQRLDARHGSGAGGCIGNKGRGGLVQTFAETFVVGKGEGLVLFDGPAQRSRRTGCV